MQQQGWCPLDTGLSILEGISHPFRHEVEARKQSLVWLTDDLELDIGKVSENNSVQEENGPSGSDDHLNLYYSSL